MPEDSFRLRCRRRTHPLVQSRARTPCTPSPLRDVFAPDALTWCELGGGSVYGGLPPTSFHTASGLPTSSSLVSNRPRSGRPSVPGTR